MTPATAVIEVQVASEADNQIAIERALRRANVTLYELRKQAQSGRFSSESCRWAWIAISPLVG